MKGNLFLLAIAVSLFSFTDQDADKEKRKLVALADKMVLAANRLSSIQDDYGLEIIDEYAPLAEYVIKSLEGKK